MRLGSCLLFSAALAACSRPYSEPFVSAKTEAPPLEVETVRVETELIPEAVSATGELFAEEEATIGAKAPGRVERLHVD